MTDKTVYLPIGKIRLPVGQEPIAASQVGNVVFTSGVPGIDLGALLLEELDVGVGRLQGDPLRQEEVPAVTGLDVDHLAALAEVALV